MNFNSIDFLLFFPIVVIVYAIIPKKARYIWLLIASYYFYMCWNAKYAILIAISTLVTYGAGILLEKPQSIKARKLIMAGGITINLGILFFFKYFNFTLDNIIALLNVLHVNIVENPFDILLPVGISFYTFQALGYMIDVYRGECKAVRNPLKYALFVSFFPQLVAGPIERSKNLIHQIDDLDEKPLMSADKVSKGLIVMIYGLFMKMVIADRVAILVDTVFGHYYTIGTVDAIVGAVGFAIQIYCDFAGYSAIAIGAAKVMGFDLMENFNTPYFSTSISEFWRRWHISLSTWFRDYVYIPLGGNRCSRIRKYRNILITFLVSGLWHGAAWTYVIWGGLHGLYQIVGDLWTPVRTKITAFLKINTDTFSYRLGRRTWTFLLTCFAWIFFRADTIQSAFTYIRRMLTHFNPWSLFDDTLFSLGLDNREMLILLCAVVILIIVDILKYKKKMNLDEFLMTQNLPFRWLVAFFLIAVVIVYGEYGINFDSAKFIYFNF